MCVPDACCFLCVQFLDPVRFCRKLTLSQKLQIARHLRLVAYEPEAIGRVNARAYLLICCCVLLFCAGVKRGHSLVFL